MPPKGRAKTSNASDKRHDTGLAAPGKRIAKDRPPLLVNGHSSGQPGSTPPPSSSPAPVASSRPDLPGDSHDSPPSDETSNGHHNSKEQASEIQRHPLAQNGASEMSRKLSVDRFAAEAAACPKDLSPFSTLAAQASSSISLAVTILAACPLRDAIAILILLLSLPPVFITTVHGLFASLTFVAPSTLLSWSSWTSLRSFSDWFQATPGGGPSPFTIACVDMAMSFIYFICPLDLQNILMGLAQTVIAISLSGAAAATESSTKSVVVCSAIVLGTHLIKHNSLQKLGADFLLPALRGLGLDIDLAALPERQQSFATPTIHGWTRSLLGCHILAQGLLTLIRRWFARRQQTSALDAEQAALLSSGKLAMLKLDGDVAQAVSVDARLPGQPSRDTKDKAIGASKRKRKQANQVRSQQPLWAAIASTKVTFMKEMEHKQLSNDASDILTGGLSEDNDRIWVVDIGPTQLSFKADLFATARQSASEGAMSVPPSPGIDKQKPFFVRVNGADWGSTKIFGAAGGSDLEVKDGLWTGEVIGLSPLTKYSCEFVRMSDQQVIYAVNLVTLSAPNTEQGKCGALTGAHWSLTSSTVVTLPAPSQLQSGRPLSPTSTLKQSIAAAEAKREEVRNKAKRIRKDHKSASSAIRREIDQLQSKVASSANPDERLRQRVLQLKQYLKQAEDATASLKQESESLGEIPQEDLDYAAARRKSFDAASVARDQAKAEFDEVKTGNNKELSSLQADISSMSQKHDRLIGRRNRLVEQYDRLLSEQHADMSARQRYEHARSVHREDRNQQIESLNYWSNVTRQQADETNNRAGIYYQEAQLIQRERAGSPVTPEGNLPGTNGPRGILGQPFEIPAFSDLPPIQTQQPWNGRQRSSSMLSGYSGFTNDIDVGPNGQMGGITRTGSSSGGSSGQSHVEGFQGPGQLSQRRQGNASPSGIARPNSVDRGL